MKKLEAFLLMVMINAGLGANSIAESATYYANEEASSIVVPPGPDLFEIIRNLLSATFGVTGIVAVIMIIIGGFYYMTSQGEPQRVQRGKNTILYGIIGMIIVLSAFAIVNFVLDGILNSR